MEGDEQAYRAQTFVTNRSLHHVRSDAYCSSVQLKSGVRPVGELLPFAAGEVWDHTGNCTRRVAAVGPEHRTYHQNTHRGCTTNEMQLI